MRLLLALCAVTALLSGVGTAQMSHEEAVVRTSYAKLAYASEQGVVAQLAMEASGVPVAKENAGQTSDQRVAAAQLTFILGDFTIGSARDILDRKAVDFISPPVGEAIQVTAGRHSYIEDGRETQWFQPVARWIPASPLPAELMEVKLAKLYELQWKQKRPDSQWKTYASYSVTVNFHGKTRGPYRALFMFGLDAQGNEIVEPEDGTTDATGLAAALYEHLFADAFVSTRLRTLPVVVNWLNGRQTSASACSAGQGVCCDLETLQCGPSRASVAAGLSAPLGATQSLKKQ